MAADGIRKREISVRRIDPARRDARVLICTEAMNEKNCRIAVPRRRFGGSEARGIETVTGGNMDEKIAARLSSSRHRQEKCCSNSQEDSTGA